MLPGRQSFVFEKFPSDDSFLPILLSLNWLEKHLIFLHIISRKVAFVLHKLRVPNLTSSTEKQHRGRKFTPGM